MHVFSEIFIGKYEFLIYYFQNEWSTEQVSFEKVQIDIVICMVPVSFLVDTVKKALYTGHIGDGKIFISPVENAVKVRTGEEGYAALQDEA